MIRDIITIDEAKCTGCGLCIPNCPEGALQIVDGKARLVSDTLCDGLGACLGECPENAILVEQREAGAYDEESVMEHIVTRGDEVIDAHLKHLESHGETAYLNIARRVLESKTEANRDPVRNVAPKDTRPQWPVQLHLVMPNAPTFQGRDVVLAADCTAYAAPDLHERFLSGKAFAIACPKLDSNLESYRDKITAMIDDAGITSLTILIMQVPCCRGLLAIATQALASAHRSIPVHLVVLDIRGEILSEERIA